MRFFAALPFLATLALAVPHPGADAALKSCVARDAPCFPSSGSNATAIPDSKFCCPWLYCGSDNKCHSQ